MCHDILKVKVYNESVGYARSVNFFSAGPKYGLRKKKILRANIFTTINHRQHMAMIILEWENFRGNYQLSPWPLNFSNNVIVKCLI